MTKDLKAALKTFKAEADKIVSRIAKDRDKLRDLIDEYADILSTVEGAEEDWDSALDKLSQLL